MTFSYRRHPAKAVYILGGTLWILIRLPFWVLRNLIPSWRPRRGWSLGRSFLVALVDSAVGIMMETFPPPAQSFDELSKTPGFVPVDPLVDRMIVGEVQRYAERNNVKPAQIAGFWYTKDGLERSSPKAAQAGEKIFYLLHGGGFVMGSASPSFPPTATIAKGLLEHTSTSGFSRAFALEYRLATGPPLPVSNPFPACLLDVLAGYYYLVHSLGFSPDNIIVAGDSAGGTLAYQLVRYCTAYGDIEGFQSNFPVPRGLLLLSPSVDAAFRPLPETSMITNKRSDYTGAWFDTRYSVFAMMGEGLTENDMDRPWLSPGSTLFSDDDEEIKGVFKDFPPSMIVTGEAEMSRDCNRTLRDRMKREMGKDKLVYLEVQDAPHDFLGATLWEPERTIALKEIDQWVRSI